MKKADLKKLALLGVASGVCFMQGIHAAEVKDAKESAVEDSNIDDINRPMTESELLEELDDGGVKLYNSLTPEGKAVALEIANATCNGTNECKGRNACKTEQNACAGKGSCKGLSKCAVSDKNLAVKLASQVMAEKRAGALKH